MAAEQAAGDQTITNGNAVPPKTASNVRDIEETVADSSFQKKKLEKVLDKTR